jgi:NadR type nicotinamide-nucleotide adenylyltransferase
MLKKIAIIGPESTGKSTLCKQLAEYYHSLWCPEYAREYLSEHGMKYTYDDLLTIAKGQVALEKRYIELAISNRHPDSNREASPSIYPLFIDTDMYVMKVWCDFVFGKCHQYILDQIAQRKYDLYLLCNIDLPWTADDLREYPDLETRQTLYEIYKGIMRNQPVQWQEISGNSALRLEKAIQFVNLLK